MFTHVTCPLSSSLSEEAIMDIIASLMVLPNRMCVPLIDQVKVDNMRFPLPRVCKIWFPLYNTVCHIIPCSAWSIWTQMHLHASEHHQSAFELKQYIDYQL